MSKTKTTNHFKNLPRKGTVVTLLDRKSLATRHALVASRVKRNGKLRLVFIGGNGKVTYTVAVPNGSNWAEDKSIRFRWAYSTITSPNFPEDAVEVQKLRKVSDVHPVPSTTVEKFPETARSEPFSSPEVRV